MPGIRRLREGYSPVGIIDASSSQEKVRDSWCQRCLDMAGLYQPLKERIYLDDKGQVTKPAADADKWLQCWRCGTIVPIFAAKQEAQIVTLTEPTDNPFDKGSDILGLTTDKRVDKKTGGIQRKSRRKFKRDLSYIKEDDIRTEVARGAKLISYQQRGDN